MNNRLLIGVLLFMSIAAVIALTLLFGAIERARIEEPTREQTAEDIGRGLFELAMAVCTANGGTLVPTEHDETGRVVAADCVTIDNRTEEVAP